MKLCATPAWMMITVIALILPTGGYSEAIEGEANELILALSDTWPEGVSYPDDIFVEIVKESPIDGSSIYKTNHFELTSDIPLSRNALCQVLEVMEATLACWKVLSIGIEIDSGHELYPVRLVSNEAVFLEVGGIRGAGGIYLPEHKQSLIRIDSLQAEWMEDGRIASIGKPGLIAHEVTHQIQHDLIGKLPIWLVEGMAVYLESVPFQDGTFRFDQKNFLKAEGIRRCTQNKFQFVPLHSLMTLTQNEWNEHFVSSPEANDRHYLTAYLLTYYLLHSDQTPDMSSLRDFIKATMSAGGEAGAQFTLETLFAVSNYDELETAMQQKYAGWGFNLHPLKGHVLK